MSQLWKLPLIQFSIMGKQFGGRAYVFLMYGTIKIKLKLYNVWDYKKLNKN